VVRGVAETANRATIDVESRGKGFLVMSVTPHKYWRVTVDGKRVAPVVTNIGYQGIVVPPGKHRVEMVYRNEIAHVGMFISAGTAAALLLMLAIARRRPEPLPQPPPAVEV
jgi:uncharacterized membrane protein YfhO